MHADPGREDRNPDTQLPDDSLAPRAGVSPKTELSSPVTAWRRPVLEKRQDLGVVETPLLRADSLLFDRPRRPTPVTLMAITWLGGQRAGAAAVRR
jgi:hypothetical protein